MTRQAPKEIEPGDRFETKCRSCDALIVMVYMRNGKWHPCDSVPQKIVTKGGQIVAGLRSHFATCPDREQWRNERESNGTR